MSVDDPNNPATPNDGPPEKKHKLRRRWYQFSRRHAILAGLILGVGALALIMLAFLLYRFGFIDSYVASQIKSTFANYGIRAEIREFHASLPPRTVEMSGVELFDYASGEKLGKIDRLTATIRIEDLYALNLQRNINLQDLKLEGLEAWVTFDSEGRSNFRNIRIPEPEPNRRILFAYSTAHITIQDGVIHYGDAVHKLAGEARNLQAMIQPDDPSAPNASGMNTVELSLSDSTFSYDNRPIKYIFLQAKGRVNQTRAEIQEFVLKSPEAEAKLTGTMDDWRALRYQMNITSSVDLTMLSNTLQTSPALRGAGYFTGTVTGEGEHYKLEGNIKSDALAAENIRLQGLNVTATGAGQGRAYQINGKAVAELLTAGDFRLDGLQLAGNVMGTGTNFKWLGELRAIAAKGYGTTVTGLILRDARVESEEGLLTASSSQFTANALTASGAKIDGITASDLKVRNQNNVTTATVASVKAGNISASGAQVQGVTANNISVDSKGGATNVDVKQVQVGATSASGAELGSINIAGVRLSVRNQRVEGSTADIDAGTLKLADGQIENVRLAKPVFVVEPSGTYRATADLSIGGGVLGRMEMGQASAKVVATSSEIQLIDFAANMFKGQATGNARIAMNRNGASHVSASFNGMDIAGPLTAMSNTVVPVSGRATGNVDVTFPGTDFRQASGTLRTQLAADTVEAAGDRIPITGEVALRADSGQFNIQQLQLQTRATTLSANGQFSIENDSNLLADLNSRDAAELQTLLISSGLLGDVEDQMHSAGISLAGPLTLNGNVRGRLTSPDFTGRVSLGSLIVNDRDLGSLSASIVMNANEVQVADGRLSEKDGGGVQFSLSAPRTGSNNISLRATLDRLNAAAMLAALPPNLAKQLGDTQADISGNVNIQGIPNAMTGTADLQFGPGKLAGEPLESLAARASFNGSEVKIESVDARLVAGHIVASGTFNTTSRAFDFQGKAEGIDVSRLSAFANRPNLAVTGLADFTAHVVGSLTEKDFSAYQITLDGQARQVTVNGRSVGTLALVGRTENKQLSITLTTGILGPPQVVAAKVNLAGEKLPAEIETTLTNADLSSLFALAMPKSAVTVSGRANGSIKASGNLLDEDDNFSLNGLSGTADFSELSFRVEDIQLSGATPLTVRFSPNEITFAQTRFTGPGTNIVLDGTVATAAGGRENLNVTGSLNLQVLNGISPDFFSSGTAEVAMRVTGAFTDPRLIGTASMNGASVSILVGNERWTVANLQAALRFTANQAQIDSFTGTLGGGRVTATGGVLLDGFAVSRFLINLEGSNVSVPFPEHFRSTLDANVELKGSAREQLITGVVNLRRTEYTQNIELADLINSRQESIEEGPEVELTRTAVFSDLRVEGRNALVVRNNLADLTGSVSLVLNGPVTDPVISGRITATSGTLNFRNDRYDITRALLDLPPARNADPIVNIQGESQIRGYRVIVSLTGPLSQPSATVRSEPALPQADVVSLITTGQLASSDQSTSILAESGLGTATSLLTDALINAPAQRATSKLFGLTRFEINPVIGGRAGSTPAARLTLGRRISKEVTVTYSTNVTSDPNQILAVEYRVSDRLSFIAQYEQGSTERLSTHNNNFNFEIRFRKRF